MSKWARLYKESEWMSKHFAIAVNYYKHKNNLDRNNPEAGLIDLAKSFAKQPKRIPSRSQYNRLVKNKFVQKLFKETFSEPIFKKKDFVKINKYYRGDKNPYKKSRFDLISTNMCAVVIKANCTYLRRAGRKSKPYLLFFPEIQKFYIVEERYLEKYYLNENKKV